MTVYLHLLLDSCTHFLTCSLLNITSIYTNNRHRERQRTLAANARSSSNNTRQQHGLGRMEDGVGYFPSLAALQFQSSIPGPSPSVAEYENSEKERLNVILRRIGFIVLVYFLLC
jgi:hypothetical protein